MDAHDGYSARPTPRGPSPGLVIFWAMVFGILAGFGGGVLERVAEQRGYLAAIPWLSTAVAVTPGTSPTQGHPAVATTPQQTFVAVADQLDESVVNINTLAHQADPMAWLTGGETQVVKGIGTGVIVDTKGYILTNYHVVGEADNIKVTVMHKSGKREYKAEFIGGDKQEDLAVIKISARNLHPVRFGDSAALRPGEPVMAVGNPFGFEHTVSVGVVSALNRSLPVDSTVTLRNMIQTDASINPGNSGGPLVNLAGEVVGINSAIFVGGGGQPQARGIGFAIPSTHAAKIMGQLRTKGKVQHPYLGISYKVITDELHQAERLPVANGVLVDKIYPHGPAFKAGLKPMDIITAVDGKALQDQSTLGDYLSMQSVGKTIKLNVMRWDGNKSTWSTLTITAKLEDMPKEFLQSQAQPQQQQPQPAPRGRGIPFPFGFPF